MLTNSQLFHWEERSMTFESKYKYYHTKEWSENYVCKRAAILSRPRYIGVSISCHLSDETSFHDHISCFSDTAMSPLSYFMLPEHGTITTMIITHASQTWQSDHHDHSRCFPEMVMSPPWWHLMLLGHGNVTAIITFGVSQAWLCNHHDYISCPSDMAMSLI